VLLGAWPCVVAVAVAAAGGGGGGGGGDNAPLPDDGYSLTRHVNVRVLVGGRLGLNFLVRDSDAVVAP